MPEAPKVRVIFHAAEYDLSLLTRQYQWSITNLFDTMWAMRILGHKNMGLSWILQEEYGVKLSKSQQKTNWGKRPLTAEQLA